jgi:chorismate dehydratase
MLRIGQIDYANCVPIFSLFRQVHETEYSFVKGVPAQLNALLADGGIDLCPSSSIEYARHADEYLLLPDLSISSVGPVQSVMLFSRVPLEALDGATIGLTGESATSVLLLRILLGRYYQFTNEYCAASGQDLATLEQVPAVLLIGDAALRAVKQATAPHVYDLGELWYAATGLPFVFALWMVRRDAVAREPAAVARCAVQLATAKERSRGAYRALAEEYATNDFLTIEELASYWEVISYDLTPAHLAGIRQFYVDAHGIGALPSVPELRFVAAQY